MGKLPLTAGAVVLDAGDRLLFCRAGPGASNGAGLRAVPAAASGAEALTAGRLPFEGARAGAGRAVGEGPPGARAGAEALLLARVGA